MRTFDFFQQARIADIRSIGASRWRYSRAGTPLDKKLEYVISTRGQTRPVLVREVYPIAGTPEAIGSQRSTLLPEGSPSHYEVIDGHRVVDALRNLGSESVVVASVGQVSDVKALLMMLEQNESRGPISHVRLAKVFKFLNEVGVKSDEIASRIDFDTDQVEGYRHLLDFDLEAFARGADSNVMKQAASPKLRRGFAQRNARLKILRDRMHELKGVRLAVWLAYCIHANTEGTKKLSLAQLEKITGYTEDMISSARTRLAREGWLERVHRLEDGAFEQALAQGRVAKTQKKGTKLRKRGQFAEDWYRPRIREPLPENNGTTVVG